MFKKKRMYFAVYDDNSDFLLITSAHTIEYWKENGTRNSKYKYYVYDPSKMQEVNMELIVSNTN